MIALRLAVLFAAVPLAAWCLVGLTAAWWWPGELACHWSRHAALLLIPAMAAWRFNGWICGPLTFAFVAGLWPWMSIVPVTALAGSHTVSVACGNILYLNQDKSGLATVLDQGAEVAVVCELLPKKGDIARLKHVKYPHVAYAQRQAEGQVQDAIALLSRYPLREIVVHGQPEAPWISAVVEFPGGPFRMAAIHPPAPNSPATIETRNRQLAACAALASSSAEPMIIAGDFNSTPASPGWSPLTRAGLAPLSGFQAGSWPAGAPVGLVLVNFGAVGIRIDHVLARGAVVQAERVFTIPGSDHRGVLATVALP